MGTTSFLASLMKARNGVIETKQPKSKLKSLAFTLVIQEMSGVTAAREISYSELYDPDLSSSPEKSSNLTIDACAAQAESDFFFGFDLDFPESPA
jgi:hypothetical protein